MGGFRIAADLTPRGDQPRAIASLVEGLRAGERVQTLLGVTGSGKTFTMAHVIDAVDRPALVIAPNKTLAAQLCNEFRELFPENAVEYFVSYYDYYQPEAYVPRSDTYIEKDTSINEDIDRLRHRATSALLLRRRSMSLHVGDSPVSDFDGARGVGMRAVLLDRWNRFPDFRGERIESLRELPDLLG